MLQSREEDPNDERRHILWCWDQFIAIVFRVQIEKVILFAINLARLVEFATGDADIFVLRFFGDGDHLS